MKKKILSLFLALMLCLSLLPAAALAADAPEQTEGPTAVGQKGSAYAAKNVATVQTYQITIRTLDGKTEINLDVELTDTVRSVKEKVEDNLKIPVANQQLVFAGKTLENKKTLADYNIQVGATVHLVVRTHTAHPICGDADCGDSSHALPDGKSWVGVSDLDEIEGEGYYYLTGPVTLTNSWFPQDGVVLCLNGQTITMNKNMCDTICVQKDVTFTLCDCKDTGTVTHGLKDGGTKYTGSGVCVDNGDSVAKANFVLYSGSISGNEYNSATLAFGAGVQLGAYANFTMHGGSISGNKTAGYSGGVRVQARTSSFTMTGGTITDNSAGHDGGGVYVKNGSFTMTGGSITGNTAGSGCNGGGVYADINAIVTLSGAPVITGNKDADGTVNNVYLNKDELYGEGGTFIGAGGLSSTASIGVTVDTDRMPTTDGSYTTIAEAVEGYAITADDAKRISADAGTGYNVRQKDNALVLIKGEFPHQHPICGDTACTEDSHALPDGEKWTGISDLSEITEAGCYYLTQDVEQTNTWAPAFNVTLCLNGHSITANIDRMNAATINVKSGVTFTLCDCNGSGADNGKLKHAVDRNNAAYFMLGNAVSVDANGTFIMYGGTITENEVDYNSYKGGAVSVAKDGTFQMHGGAITGNRIRFGWGGVVYVDGTFNMTGGEITNNQAIRTERAGANSYDKNTALGGGVYVAETGTMTVSGKVKITQNERRMIDNASNNTLLSQQTGNVYLESGRTIQIVGALDAETRIGVTSAETLSAGTPVTVATLAEGAAYNTGNIFSDAGDPSVVLLEGTSVNLYSALPHIHPICGAAHKDINGHTGACHDVSWTAWDGTSEIEYDTASKTAYVYLTGEAERDSTLTVASGYTLYLCLNGHSITMNKGDGAITVNSDATLTLCDCSEAQSGTITHGVKSDGTKYTGRGVYVIGIFHMYGGNITGNTLNTWGGGVSLSKPDNYRARFYMYGGSITDNSATIGGGVYLIYGNAYMYGGSITGNAATDADSRYGGGGVYMASGRFYMYGGSITGNTSATTGGGAHLYGGIFEVAGNVDITGNTSSTAKGADDNVYLPGSSSHIYISKDGLNESARIGVTKTITSGSYVTVASFVAAGTCKAENFVPDAGGDYGIKIEKDPNNKSYVQVNLYSSLPHEHPLCGKTCADGDHTEDSDILTWTGVASLADIAGDGHYYLTGNVTLSDTWTCNYNVDLCLNGHSITLKKGSVDSTDAIKVAEDMTFTLTDCNGSRKTYHFKEKDNGLWVLDDSGEHEVVGGIITHAEDERSAGVSVLDGGKFIMYGGTIVGNTANGNGGGVFVESHAEFAMNGGAITGNTGSSGAGVCVSPYRGGTFTMNGGTISHNTGAYGAGVSAGGTFTMNGGSITGNKGTARGGGVDVNHIFVMNGGSITGNTVTDTYYSGAEGAGGGVYFGGTTFAVSGGAEITGNTDKGGAPSNVYLASGKTVEVTGALTGTDCIGVSTADAIADGSYLAVAEGHWSSVSPYTLTAGDLNAFTSDAGYGKLLNGGSVVFTNGKLHQHAVCGKETCADGHDTAAYLPLTYDAATQTLYCGGTPVKSKVVGFGLQMDDSYLVYATEYTLAPGSYYLQEDITLTGGTVTYNNKEVTSSGGVIRLGTDYTTDNKVNLCLNGNTLSTAIANTSMLYVGEANTLNLSDCGTGGRIQSTNNAYKGIYINASARQVGTFNMYGGTISGTKTGVELYNGGAFNMYGGSITGNSDGGVRVGGTFTMYGGEITGNTAAENGGGVYVRSSGTFRISGKVTITGNTGADGKTANVYLSTKTGDKTKVNAITMVGELDPDARIGITTAIGPSAESSVQFAAGAASDTLDYLKIFTADEQDKGYVVTKDDNGGLILILHQHVWQYEKVGDDTIKATCTANGCNNRDGGSVTIVKPAHEVYGDGKEAAATLTQNSWTADDVNSIQITYAGREGTTYNSTTAPTNAGDYTANITLTSGDGSSVTVSENYTIGKATPQAKDFNFSGPQNPAYDGTPKTAWVTSNTIGGISVHTKYYKDGVEVSRPSDVGIYTVKIDVTVQNNNNYQSVNDLTDSAWTFAIVKGTYEGAKSDKTIEIVKGRSTAQTGTLTAANFFPEGTALPAGAQITDVDGSSSMVRVTLDTTKDPYTLTYTSSTNITDTVDDTYTVTISTTNHNDITATLTFRPVDKRPQTNFAFADVVGGKVTKTYGNADFTFLATGQVEGSTEVLYFSSEPTVATVDAQTGKVHILSVGTTTIRATASATDDYAQGVATYELTVTPKNITVTVDAVSRTYGDENPDFTATVPDGALVGSDTIESLDLTLSTEATAASDVGSYDVTVTASNTNYSVSVEGSKQLTIQPRTVTVTVDAVSRSYGDGNPTFTVKVDSTTPLVNGDTVESLGLTLSTEATATSKVGKYDVTGTASSGNYDVTVEGKDKLTVTPKSITVTVDAVSRPYGDENPTFTAAVPDGALVGSDTIESLGLGLSSTATATSNVGSYDVTGDGEYNENYTVTIAGEKKLTVTQLSITVTAENKSSYVGHDLADLTYTYAPELVGDDTFTGALETNADKDVVGSSYTITKGTLKLSDNYEIKFHPGTYTVLSKRTQADFSFLEDSVTKTYGTDKEFTMSASGEAEGSKVTYRSSNETVATVDEDGNVTIVGAGTATITATASETDDFAETEARCTLTVNKLRIPVPEAGKTKFTYNGQTQFYQPAMEEIHQTYTSISGHDKNNTNVGKYTATVELTDPANTEWDTSVGGDAASKTYDYWVTPAPVTVTVLDKKITAGRPAPDLLNAQQDVDYLIEGLIGDDTLNIRLYYAEISDLSTEVTPNTAKAGTYAIVAEFSDTGDANYDVVFVSGTLTVHPNSGDAAVYPIQVSRNEHGTVSVSPKAAAGGSTVTITVRPDSGYRLDDLTVTDSQGNRLSLTDKGSGSYTFTMPFAPAEVSVRFAAETEHSPFLDVSKDKYYYEAVKWAAEQGIADGIGNGLFGPERFCTRAQIVTFLWRAAGSPEPQAMSSFTDVPAEVYYAKAVAWAVEQGIAKGTGDGKFSPDALCTRGQIVTFLWRRTGVSEVQTANSFTDVSAEAYYAKAIAWAVEQDIAKGTGDGKFSPNGTCTRAQSMTFLWRLQAGK